MGLAHKLKALTLTLSYLAAAMANLSYRVHLAPGKGQIEMENGNRIASTVTNATIIGKRIFSKPNISKVERAHQGQIGDAFPS